MNFDYEDILKSVINHAITDFAIIYFSMKRRLVNFQKGRSISNLRLVITLAVVLIIELILWFKFKFMGMLIQLLLLPFVLRLFDIQWVKELVNYLDNNDSTDNKMTIFYLINSVFATISDIEMNTRASFHDDKTALMNLQGKFISLKMTFVSSYDGYFVSSYLNEDYCKSNHLLPIADTNYIFIDITYLIDENEDAYVNRLIENDLGNDWQSIKEYKENQQFERIARQQEEYNDKINNLVKSKKAREIVRFIDKKGNNFGLSLWNLNKSGIKETGNALVVRCILNEDTTIKQVKQSLSLISKKVRVAVSTEELADKGSINLVFQLNNNYIGKKMSVDTIVKNADESVINLGEGDFGNVSLQLPHIDFPAILVGGLSRSGKSALNTMLTTSLLSLHEEDGQKSYRDVFIGTVKDEDYSALGWQKQGMYIAGNAMDAYEMLVKVDDICTARKQQFIKNGVTNIKQYNAKHSDSTMGKILIIMDEYANLLGSAESQYIELEGKKVKLSNEIERLCIKIAQEHISRGATLIVITQNFAKNAMGKVFDALGTKFVGYAPSNVANSIDNTQELANAMKNDEESRQGLFFVSAPDLKPTTNTLLHKMNNSYYKVRTNYVETSDVKKNFNNTYLTASKYQNNTTPPDDGSGVKKITSLDDI
ncbi:hypothetical protein [Companilactobacillus sp. FL22-1]|uniref:hypothetical protein n=1 Tax=Companilactobacillus sp. FL22-1 TaxID=3373892 RepID=UPI0037550FE7